MKTISSVRRKPTERTRLQQLRDEAHLGVREIAGYVGVSAATIVRVESGKAPDICSALRLAQFFETSVEDLFGTFRNKERNHK